MITLHKSHIESSSAEKVRLITPVTETTSSGNITHDIWVEVEKCYEKYLCHERCDAILLGLLHYCLKNGHDIVSEVPVSRELYFNLTNLLIPVLCSRKNGFFKKISLQMELSSDALPNAQAVGTGISLGVDSFYTICKHHRDGSSPYPVTHLLYFNVGSHGRGESAEHIHQNHLKKIVRFAEEYQYTLVTLNSNYSDVFRQHYYDMHAFAGAFAAFSLQKLWSTYLYASAGYPEINITLPAAKNTPAALLMPILNGVFVTENMHFRADAEGVSRFEKIRFLSQYEMVQKYLLVCTRGVENCCRCAKCIRTILTLRICGALKNFSSVFPESKCSLFREIYSLFKKLLKKNSYSKEIIAEYFNKNKRRSQ